jgi:hypothetical protein
MLPWSQQRLTGRGEAHIERKLHGIRLIGGASSVGVRASAFRRSYHVKDDPADTPADHETPQEEHVLQLGESSRVSPTRTPSFVVGDGAVLLGAGCEAQTIL